MKGLSQLMRQAQEMQANMQKAQDELAATEVEGVAGGGMVKVVVTCKHEVRRVTIEGALLKDDKRCWRTWWRPRSTTRTGRSSRQFSRRCRRSRVAWGC